MTSDGVMVDVTEVTYVEREREERPSPQEVGVRLAVDDAGTGEPAVVLLHGWGFGNPSHLAPQLEHLAARRRVLKLDLPGHGRSEPPPEGFGFEDCAAAIVAKMDEAGLQRAVICGHSFGGRLAVVLAAAFPARVAGIALLDPVILFPAPVRDQALTGLVPALLAEHAPAALEGYFSRLLRPYDPPDVQRRVLAELSQVKPKMAAALMQEGMASDGADYLARVRCPVLAVSATAPVDYERFQDLLPEALVGKVAGSGHWLTLSVPDQVNAMLDRFLELVTGRR